MTYHDFSVDRPSPKEGNDMTDRELDQVREEPQDDLAGEDHLHDDIPSLVGEEIDPDSVRPVPDIDDDGDVIEEDLEEIRRGEY